MDKPGYIDPVTSEYFGLDHLQPFTQAYKIRVKIDGTEKEVEVSLMVLFSNHCYTRTRLDSDPSDLPVLFSERKRDGTIDERVFCRSRWEFSKTLPDLINDLHGKSCLPGGSREIFYRQEDSNPIGSPQGWYVCLRLNASDKHKNLTLSVRSSHYRVNRPNDVRGSHRRFYAILAHFYSEELKVRKWLEMEAEPVKQKNP